MVKTKAVKFFFIYSLIATFLTKYSSDLLSSIVNELINDLNK